MPRWLDRVRLRAPAIVALAAVAAGAAAVYSFTATKRYEARAELLVSPLPGNDRTFDGFGLPREAGPAAETTARLVQASVIADAVQAQLGLRASVSSYRLGGSQLVAVVGRASSPVRAARIANGFADALVAVRTARFQAALATAIRRLRARLRAGTGGARERAAVAGRLGVLTALVATRDPTVEVASAAVPPRDPIWPRTRLLVVVATAAALAVATLAAALVPASAPAPEPRPPAPPPPPPPPPPEPESANDAGGWNLGELRRLVEERGASFPPDRIELWRSYLSFLEEHAGSDGALPDSFDALVEDEFRELLA
jgi:uncharacterized protein involved in exopolysaccharide biosynthesis